MSEFSGLPMARPPPEDCIGDSYKAQYTMQYLEEYSVKMVTNGIPLSAKINFGVHVKSVKKFEGVWRVECLGGEKECVYTAGKMMVATGVHDQAYIPQFQEKNTFNAPSKTSILKSQERPCLPLQSSIQRTSALRTSCPAPTQTMLRSWVLASLQQICSTNQLNAAKTSRGSCVNQAFSLPPTYLPHMPTLLRLHRLEP